MRCFQKVRAYYSAIGFSPNSKPLNPHYVNGFCASAIAVAFDLMYLKNVASTAEEYANSLYLTAVAIATSLCYLNVILMKTALFDYFDEVDENFNSSKSLCPENFSNGNFVT